MNYRPNRHRSIRICQNASRRLGIQTAEFVFCLHDGPGRGSAYTERSRLFFQGGISGLDQNVSDEMKSADPENLFALDAGLFRAARLGFAYYRPSRSVTVFPSDGVQCLQAQ